MVKVKLNLDDPQFKEVLGSNKDAWLFYHKGLCDGLEWGNAFHEKLRTLSVPQIEQLIVTLDKINAEYAAKKAQEVL